MKKSTVMPMIFGLFAGICSALGAQSLILQLPVAGGGLALGSEVAIKWIAPQVKSPLRLVLFRNGVRVGNIADNLSAEKGQYMWKVGNYQGGAAVAGGGYVVRLRTVTAGPVADSPAFNILPAPSPTIVMASVRIDYPSGVIYRTADQNQINIRWSWTGLDESSQPYRFYMYNIHIDLELLDQNGSRIGWIIRPDTANSFNYGYHHWQYNVLWRDDNSSFPFVINPDQWLKVKLSAFHDGATLTAVSSPFRIVITR